MAAASGRSAAAVERLLREERLVEGEHWFLVSSRWWARVLGGDATSDGDAVGLTDDDSEGSDAGDGRRPGAAPADALRVTNEPLVDTALSCRERGVAVLQPMLAEARDYRLVGQRVWTQLSHDFGFDWEIARRVVALGPGRKLRVEVNPVAFQLLVWHPGLDAPVEALDERQKPLVLLASEASSLSDVENKIWITLQTQLQRYFPHVKPEDVTHSIQVSYRLDEAQPWVSLADAVVTEGGFEGVQSQQVLVESTTVGELQLEPRDYKPGRDKLHHLLIETRFADPSADHQDWRLGRYYSDIQANVWRFELEENQLVDALDTDNKWYESRVLELSAKRVKVHYRGWTAKWDEWLDRMSPRLAPLHSKVPNWRDFHVGDDVMVGRAVANRSYPEWRNARVTACEPSADGTLRIEVEVDDVKQRMDAQDEMLCPPGTHKAANAVTTVAPVATYSSASSNGRYADRGRSYGSDAGRGVPEFEGVVGLANLGNTCFLNSILQCLVNTAPVRAYFLAKLPDSTRLRFGEEINVDNPLGMKGRMAIQFADLVQKVWHGEYRVVTPTSLKSVIGQYAPQFAGYQQQDSQEVLNFLLDGLHEDLNRVKAKPYTAPVEPNGRCDEVVAREEWQQFLRRNDSVIVDNFMGQLRSHVTCSNSACHHESVTFDPYMSLSVPIPSRESVVLKVQLFWANGRIPTKYAVRLPKDGCTLREAKDKLSVLSGVSVARIFFVEVLGHRILKTYKDATSVENVREDLLHAYELELPVEDYDFASRAIRPPVDERRGLTTSDDQAEAKKMQLVALLHQAPVASPVDGRANSEGYDMLVEEGYGPKQRRVEVELFNTPLLVSIDREWTRAQVHDKVWQVVHRLVTTKETEPSFGCGDDEQLPYRLQVTGPNGGPTLISDFPRDDEPAKLPDAEVRTFSFTLQWHRNGYQLGYNEDSAKRIDLHESMQRLHISPGPEPITLRHCLSKFTEREQLGPTNTWFCPKCKDHVRAFKKFDLFSLPKVLVFHLKRFRYAQNSFYLHRDKISTLVDFPIEALDLADFVIGPQRAEPLLYDLYAVSEHSGGLGGGHYTAIAKNPVNERWFSFNDSYTAETSAAKAVSTRAYVLFYVRREQA